MTVNKLKFDKVNQSVLQDIAGKLVADHVYVCQSGLVGELLSKDIISYDNYENLYLSDKQLKETFDVTTDEEIEELRNEGSDVNEVYEHWIVSDWLEHQLEKLEEPLLKTDFQNWWGRTCSGQAICLDYNIQKLAYDYSGDERLYEMEGA